MKYCVTILVGLAALLMPQIVAGSQYYVVHLGEYLIKINDHLVSEENTLNNQTTNEELRNASRSRLLRYLSDATKEVENIERFCRDLKTYLPKYGVGMVKISKAVFNWPFIYGERTEAKRINKSTCATSFKSELYLTIHSILNTAAVTKCIEENMPNWKTIINQEGDRLEVNFAAENKKCIFNSNPDNCLGPVIAQFYSYTDKYNKYYPNMWLQMGDTYKQKADDVLQCPGINRALKTIKIKLFRRLSQ